ncbi:DUF4105 domain-containing protein [Lentisphaerota bacterium ZTH]|nr:DUF4105 domain-containing protein [Lentisphaerota bacterium]WET06456.1 DUF4105 domain-containing protein [Lentisphaerota bacterium ZTH]
MRLLLKILYSVLFSGVSLWCFGAVWYLTPDISWLRISAVSVFTVLIVCMLALVFIRPRVGILSGICLVTFIITWYSFIPASNDGNWQASCSRLPEVTFEGSRATVKNLRDFKYRTVTDFQVNYITRSYDLDKLRSLDFAVVRWNGNRAVAHTMLSFGFDDGRYLVVSAETRLRKGQRQSGIKGLYKQYNIIYILGTEEDLFRLRTNFRRELLYLYPTTSTPAEARLVLTDLFRKCNRLLKKPKFYNTITYNCTSSLIPSLNKIRTKEKFDIRVYLNGYSDEMAFENGWLRHQPGEDFIDYQARHLTNLYVERVKKSRNYSQIIRIPFTLDYSKGAAEHMLRE